MPMIKVLYQAVLEGRRKEVEEIVQKVLDNGVPVLEIISETLQPAMSEVGNLFSQGEYYLPELILSANAMKNASEYLRPYLVNSAGGKKQQCIVIGTVEGDLHDIGKNLVAALLEGNGYKVVDLGINVPPERFIAAIREHDPKVVGMSALLTTTMINVPATIKAIEKEDLRKGRILAVGGASMTQHNAELWGVEIYAPDAGTAVKMINERLN